MRCLIALLFAAPLHAQVGAAARSAAPTAPVVPISVPALLPLAGC